MRRISLVLAVVAVMVTLALPAGTPAQEATPEPGTLTRTDLRYVVPFTEAGLGADFTVTANVSGSCTMESLLVGQRPDAWECTGDDDQIYDPCFENAYAPEGAAELACFTASPFTNEVVLLTPDSELVRERQDPTGDALFDAWALPWGLALANGDDCVLQSEVERVVAGEAVYYGCADGGAILGEPLRAGAVWVVHYLAEGATASRLVEVTAAWS